MNQHNDKRNMFRKLSLNFPPKHGTTFGVEDATEALDKAWAMYRQLTFEWIIVDRPYDGTIFVFQLGLNEPVPDDGYGWMDDEIVQRTVVNGKEVEVAVRKAGFAFGDQFISMSRTRYRIVNSDLNLLHYCELPQTARMPVNPNSARKYPRNPATLSRNTEPHTPSASMSRPPADAFPKASPSAPPRKTELSRKRQRANKTVVRTVEDEHEPSGDELDASIESLVALERYKRNHEFIDQVFSPYSVAGLGTFKEDVKEEDVADLKTELETLRKEHADMEARYKAEKDQMAADSKGIWKAVEEVKQAGNLGGLDDIERRTVEGLGVRLKPHGVVEAVEIPV